MTKGADLRSGHSFEAIDFLFFSKLTVYLCSEFRVFPNHKKKENNGVCKVSFPLHMHRWRRVWTVGNDISVWSQETLERRK